MASNIFSLLILAFFCLLSFRFSEAQKVPALFVFGDSLVDVGNNNYLPVSVAKANFPHNGVDFPTKQATGRFSNGKNAADLFAEKVGLPSPPPYLSLEESGTASSIMTGVSFASGGAGILDGIGQNLNQYMSMTKQVENFATVYQALVKQLGSAAAQQHLSKSLFGVVIGSNDLFNYLALPFLRMQYTPQQYINLMITNLEAQLKSMYGNRARKFVVIGVAAVGCCPSLRLINQTKGCNEEANYWAVTYNDGLKSMLQKLKSQLSGMSYSYFETYDAMLEIIQNPARYGFKEVKEACCGFGELKAEGPCLPIASYCNNRNDHVFWDLFHPSQATARIFVDEIFYGHSQHSFPINVRQLIAI